MVVQKIRKSGSICRGMPQLPPYLHQCLISYYAIVSKSNAAKSSVLYGVCDVCLLLVIASDRICCNYTHKSCAVLSYRNVFVTQASYTTTVGGSPHQKGYMRVNVAWWINEYNSKSHAVFSLGARRRINYVICSLKSVFLSFLLCGRSEEACSMVNSLRKVDFSHPTGHYTCKKSRPPPLRKSWVRRAPLHIIT